LGLTDKKRSARDKPKKGTKVIKAEIYRTTISRAIFFGLIKLNRKQITYNTQVIKRNGKRF
jgi:hypothetical protein